ncbi:MAG: ribosomal protein L7/L12 [Planctomycetes bacterium]|nr:ribosomal protein L7/L12 [Planctomycetota bacterium]
MDDAARRIGEWIAAGKKIDAIKELREASGLGLAEAKAIVDAVEAGRPVPAELVARLQAAREAKARGNVPDAVRAAVERGNRIEAIRLLREHTGFGLKEAKDLLDREMPVPAGARRGCLLPLLFGCLVGAAAGAAFV